MPDPAPVTVENVVKTESVDQPKPAPATTETVTEKHETTKTVGDAALIQAPPPAVIADDNIRKWVAQEAIITDFILACGILYLLFFHTAAVTNFVAGTIGTIVGYKARDVGTVYNYLFGSSSGSTAKSALLDKK